MKRSSYLRYDEVTPLGKKGLKIWAYDPKEKFVCRLEFNGAGIAVFSGTKGGKRVANLSWERFVKKLK